ncbi:copper transporter [Cryptosporidium ryanae]|uniref:copper transporter n=1 Tax=Cryptosporidium ryanae TaxID=515981 RepID=UPI003519E492|nr:copper transporter [Cryptosporidium ryanae]
MCCANKNTFQLIRDSDGLSAKIVKNPTMNEIKQINNKGFVSISMQMVFHQSFESLILFDFWKTKNPLEYFTSCFIIILLGWFTMYLSSINKGYIREIKKNREKQINRKVIVYSILLSFCYYFLNYLLMLVAMTFNWGLFISVIIGLSLGYGMYEMGSIEKDTCICNMEYEYPSCC